MCIFWWSVLLNCIFTHFIGAWLPINKLKVKFHFNFVPFIQKFPKAYSGTVCPASINGFPPSFRKTLMESVHHYLYKILDRCCTWCSQETSHSELSSKHHLSCTISLKVFFPEMSHKLPTFFCQASNAFCLHIHYLKVGLWLLIL